MFSALEGALAARPHDPDRARSRRGELCLGTVDSWLLSRLGGEHVIEVGNASRTQLLDVRDARAGIPQLLELFGVPDEVLPRDRRRPAGPFPAVRGLPPLRDGTPVHRGDGRLARRAVRPRRLAARAGQGDLRHRLLDHEPRPTRPTAGPRRLCLTDRLGRRRARLRPRGQHPRQRRDADLAGRAARHARRTSSPQLAAPSSDGVHLVPAFGGLGAPWWDDAAVGLLSGLTFGTRLPQLARAALESIAFQVEDVVAAVDREARPVQTLLADGGPTANRDADAAAGRHERPPRRARARAASSRRSAPPTSPGVGAGVWDRERARGARARARGATSPSRTAASRRRADRALGTPPSRALAARHRPHDGLTRRRRR